MIVWPGLRRCVSAISRLFNSAAFDAPLTHSAVPTRAASGTTATFTRATTATVRDNEGVLRTAIAGEARFEGARRVRNLLSNTENLTAGGGWTVSNATSVVGAIDPNGGATAFTMTATAGNGQVYRNMAAGVIGQKTLTAWYLRRVSGSGQIQLLRGDGSGDGAIALTSSWQRFTSNVFTATNTSQYSGVYMATSGDVIEIWHPQLEDVTAQTTQTAGEYVSVGVESAPYYHGSFVDGVKCFPTDLAGNPLTTMLGYLAEGARTNLCLQSQTFDNASWVKDSITVSANATTAPDGTTTADLLYPASSGTTGDRRTIQTITVTAAVNTVSIYLKYAGFRWVMVTNADAGAENDKVWVDVQNGVLGTVGAGSTSAEIESAGNGWYRVSITATNASTTGYCFISPADGNGSNAVTANGTDGVYAWGAQVELGSFASSYIPTTTAAVTRNADVLTYSSAGNILGTAGWAYAEISTNWSVYPGSTRSAVGFGAATEGILSGGVSGVPTEIRAYDGTNSVTASGNPTMYQTPRKTAIGWGSSLTITQTGVTASGTFDGNIGTTAIGVGCSATGTQVWDGTIRNVRIGQRQLSTSEQGAITA